MIYHILAICFFYASNPKSTLLQHSFSFLGNWLTKSEITELIENVGFTVKLPKGFMHSDTRAKCFFEQEPIQKVSNAC